MKSIEQWSRVVAMEDINGGLHLRNLKFFEARTEEEAGNFLFVGNLHRITSETPMNQVFSKD